MLLLFCITAGQLHPQSSRLELQSRLCSLQNTVTENSLPDFQTPVQEKKAFVAICYSLLLPGMGEWYADNLNSGKYYLMAEGGIWLTYASVHSYGTWMQSDARTFARTHAGFSPDAKDDQFYVNVGNFSNVYDYNEKKLRDRDLDKVYDPSAGYVWNWDSEASRQRFRSLRVSSDGVITNSGFIIAAAVVNRIVSAVNAARCVRQYNKALEEGIGMWQIGSQLTAYSGKPDGVLFSFTRTF